MNKIIILIVTIALFFTSCKDQSNESGASKIIEATHETEHTDSSVMANDWMTEIQLNDGYKWMANPETNEGVAKMQSLLKTSAPKNLTDYHTIADTLNHEKNYVIKECTMKGPSHENLHVWLLPLMEKIGALKDAKTLDEAQRIYKSIAQNVNAYTTYFQ